MFDIKYMFTQIRSKSVGESTKLWSNVLNVNMEMKYQ